MKLCSTVDIKAGIHEIPFNEYLADPCPNPSFSSGTANAIVSRSPRHAWYQHPRLNPDRPQEQSAAMDIGKAVHALFLENDPSHFAFIDAPDYRTKAAQAQRAEAHDSGRIPLLPAQYDLARTITDASHEAWDACLELRGLFEKRLVERTVLWTEDEAGTLWCRARPDLISDEHTLIINVKTTKASAQPDEFGTGTLIRGGYHIQAYHHCRGLESLFGKQVRYIWMAIEQDPPYGCSFIGMSPSLRALAEAQWEHAFAIWQDCLESGKWPGYPSRVCWVDAPGWQLKKWTERPDVSEVDTVLGAMEHIGGFVT